MIRKYGMLPNAPTLQKFVLLAKLDEHYHLIVSFRLSSKQVDIVTMLDEAVHYVQFLQLQVKVGHLFS